MNYFVFKFFICTSILKFERAFEKGNLARAKNLTSRHLTNLKLCTHTHSRWQCILLKFGAFTTPPLPQNNILLVMRVKVVQIWCNMFPWIITTNVPHKTHIHCFHVNPSIKNLDEKLCFYRFIFLYLFFWNFLVFLTTISHSNICC